MFAYELPLNPPYDYWEEYEKPLFIADLIKDICENILKRGEKTHFQEFYDALYLQIEDNIKKYLHEADYDDDRN